MEPITADYHVHSNFSDGADIREMIEAAVDAGFETVGFADHCVPYDDRFDRSNRYDFDETYRQRREIIRDLNGELDIEILDGAEINYDPAYESEIMDFIKEADFDYVIGSVHYADEYNFSRVKQMAEFSTEEKKEAIETYVDWQCKLIRSELFDIVGHLDFPQRKSIFQGLMNQRHYESIAQELTVSLTRSEINAGGLNSEYEQIHPHPKFLYVFNDMKLIIGSDSHTPSDVREFMGLFQPIISESSINVSDL